MILKTYVALESYVAAFAKGHINLLILVGPPGLAKSRTVRAILPDEASWIEGNATAFGMYLQLYKSRDRFVVIDDVDSLYSDKNGIRLLKCYAKRKRQRLSPGTQQQGVSKKLAFHASS